MSFFSSLGRLAVTTFLSFVCAYYFLVEKENITVKLKKVGKVFIPKKIYENIMLLLKDINSVFAGYIRGQILDAVIMAALISGSLGALGIKYSLLIGIVSGFSNIIPYFGAIIGFLLGVSAALIGGKPIKMLYVGITIIVLQQIDSVIISPKIVGNKVSLSPVAVILALTVAGRLFGITGMIFAVPTTALIKLTIKRIYNKKSVKVIGK
jgi:predicted PurR-regulated permease PerM